MCKQFMIFFIYPPSPPFPKEGFGVVCQTLSYLLFFLFFILQLYNSLIFQSSSYYQCLFAFIFSSFNFIIFKFSLPLYQITPSSSSPSQVPPSLGGG